MPNRLSESTSPYLLQHKDNPVEWWEWSDEAFDEARRRDVPVLLSVGYSACHWCHVMAHESFEDAETASMMNDRFVNVKVDREERPDVDSIYMEAVQAMTGRGGWPMTVWLTPDRRPFFAGTYFPKTAHHGMPGFGQVIAAVSEAWETNRSGVDGQADQLVSAISRDLPPAEPISPSDLDEAARGLVAQFDATFGGFGSAPKFPQQPVLEFLLRRHDADPSVDNPLRVTLERMADGGIHDHLAGGFARYSVDRRWLVPHFEKMLYDNAQLARIYLWAGIELDEPRFLSVARKTLDYLLDYMRHPGGGFFSAEDADSEGVEGKFYVWDVAEARDVLGDRADAAIEYFGMTESGNFEGANILHLAPGRPRPDDLDQIVSTMLEHRDRRVRPGLDDKIVAAWNGLAIRALAEAGGALDDDAYVSAATAAADFIADEMIAGDRIARSWREGRRSGPGFLDDYAAMAVGLQALYQATGDTSHYELSETLVSALGRFEEGPGRFFTTTAGDGLVKRPRDVTDNPLPSGNALAAEALLRSSLFSGDSGRRERAELALGTASAFARKYPSMVGHHLAVATSLTRGTRELAIVGTHCGPLASVFWGRFRPHMVVAVSSDGSDSVPLLRGRVPVDGRAAAYVCEGFVCDLPTTDPVELAASIG